MNPEERKRILAGKGKKVARRSEKTPDGKTVDGKEVDGAKKRKPEPMTWQEHLISWVKTIFGALIIVMIVNGLLIQSFVVPTESMENEVMAGDFVFVNRFLYGGSTPQTIPFLNVPLPYLRLPGLRDPEKNDVIVFIYPGNRDDPDPGEFQYYLKRCVAVAGDTLEVRDGVVHVNGVPETPPENMQRVLDKPLSTHDIFPKGSGFTRNNWGPMRIPKEGDVIMLSRPEDAMAWKVFIEREGHAFATDGQIITIDGKTADSYTVERDYVFGMGDNRDNSEDSRYWGFIPMENVVGTPLIVYWSWENRNTNIIDPNTGRPLEYSLGEKLQRIRWGRIFNGID